MSYLEDPLAKYLPELKLFEQHRTLVDQMNQSLEPFRRCSELFDPMVKAVVGPFASLQAATSPIIESVERHHELARKLARDIGGPLAALQATTSPVVEAIGRDCERVMRAAREVIEPLASLQTATSQIVEAVQRDFDAAAKLARSFAEPVLRLNETFAQHRALSSWLDTFPSGFSESCFPALRLSRDLERAAEAAARLIPHVWIPTEHDLVAHAAAHSDDESVLQGFTVNILGIPRRHWLRVGAALYLKNWRASREPLRLLRDAVHADVHAQDRSRMTARLDYQHSLGESEGIEPAHDPRPEIEQRLWAGAIVKRIEELPLSDDERALLRMRAKGLSHEACRQALKWDVKRLERVRRALSRHIKGVQFVGDA